jgi:2-oxoglutarate ferredoxin oxidoreductase subunit alpha
MAIAGDGYRFHVTGLTHDERGYPSMTVEAQDKLVRRLIDKIEKNKHYIIDIEEDGIDDADVVVCSYGVSARVSRLAIQQARSQGIKVGFLRLITIWPFPEERIRQIARKVKAFVVPELNSGQISLEVERCAAGLAKTLLVSHLGGAVHNPDVILSSIKKAAK